MLKLRLITAAVLAGVLVPTLLITGPWVWAGVSLLFVIAAGWEWQHLLVSSMRMRRGLWFPWVLAASGSLALYGWWRNAAFAYVNVASYAVVSFFWLGMAWPLLRRLQVHRLPLLLVWLLLLSAWCALVDARLHGISYLLSLIFLVIAADTCAYFVGRSCGRHKLAPQISPGKTVEGAIGGILGVALVATVFIQLVPAANFFSLSWRKLGIWAVLLWLALAVIAIIGDLFESALKRALNVKDSSQLLPGHGGVLDRIDALLPVLPLAMLATWLLENF